MLHAGAAFLVSTLKRVRTSHVNLVLVVTLATSGVGFRGDGCLYLQDCENLIIFPGLWNRQLHHLDGPAVGTLLEEPCLGP